MLESDVVEEQAAILSAALERLSIPRQQGFWRYVALIAKRLSHTSREHARVCLAVHDATRGGTRPRLLGSIAPVARRLSAEDMQRAVLRFKLHLLQTTTGAPFIIKYFCMWVQTEHLSALLAILDATECPHDNKGIFRGTFPVLTPAFALPAICSLLDQYDNETLALVCSALIVDGLDVQDRWGALRPVIGKLFEEQEIKEQLVQKTETSLVSPPLVENTPSVVNAAFVNNKDQTLVSLLDRCAAIRHVSDPNFSGMIDISRALALVSDATIERAALAPEPLAGIASLLKIVEQGDSLEDVEFEHAREAIDVTFGSTVATAAVRGRLRVPDACIPEKHIQEENAPEPSNAIQGEAEPDAITSPTEINLLDSIEESPSALVAPRHFCGFEGDFEQEYWIDGSGRVDRAPWQADGYAKKFSDAAAAAWQAGEFGSAYVHAASLALLGAKEQLWLADLQHADQVLSDPTSFQAGIDKLRVTRLREALLEPDAILFPGVGLSLTLEAMRPTQPCTLSAAEIDQLLTLANFRNGCLATVLSWTLNAWAAGANPLPQLRESAQASPPEDPKTLLVELADAERQFKETVAQYWSAAGGRLRQTHCRKIWMRFIIDDVAPLRSDFGNSSKAPHFNATQLYNKLRAGITALANLYPSRMEEIKYQDRVAADHAAQQIFEKLNQLAEILQRVGVHQRQAKNAFDACPHEDIRRLMSEVSGDSTDQLCALLIVAVLRAECSTHPLRLAAETFGNWPDLVKHVRESAIEGMSLRGASIAVQDIVDFRAASALLITTAVAATERDDDTLMTVRQFAIEYRRQDILSALAPSHVLEPYERTLLLKGALEVAEDLYLRLKELEYLWTVCDLLMIAQSSRLQMILDEARTRVAEAETINSLIDGRLLQAWLGSNIAAARACIAFAETEHMLIARERSAEIGQVVEDLLQQKRYREAARVLHGEAPLVAVAELSARETIWRTDAVAGYSEPRSALLTDLQGGTNEAQVELTTRWLAAAKSSDQEHRDLARRSLYAFASREYDTRRRSVVRLTDLRDLRERKIVIDCVVLREYFQRSGLNPTFLPQLADFSKVVLTMSSTGAGRGTVILDEWARMVAAEPEGSLVVFLEPGLTPVRRDEISDGLRRRRLTAAVIDDIDVCRLCVAGGRSESVGFVGLLEIIFEQLDLLRVSPFSAQDGQHVRIESYVGRADEAEQLALRNRYSCVFSGRKLGKSALLKYVAHKYDRHRLGSGMQLNVIFITIAGGDSEHWIVQCIIDAITQRFKLVEDSTIGVQRPRDRLSAYMHRFLQVHLNDSLLLVLDEADTFVEGQLARYDTDREASLSFCLLKELPTQVDSNGLPRIRTVFSGYRVTNTRDGVWANAGDVLVLSPLNELEAIQFITGTLAKIGVDIGEHAAYIARRCGFQPAVLIRFGESLLKQIVRSYQGGRREVIIVSEGLVSAALNGQGVQDEIRTVVANNFQGHKVGQVIFTATIMALKDLVPGHSLLDAPAQILGKLREIDADLAWLERLNASPMAVIESHLQNFIERELMMVAASQRFGEREYRLKFPHFLPVLTHSDMALDARQLIAAVRASSKEVTLSHCALTPTSLDKVRDWYREANVEECRLVVVGGHWLAALLHAKCGVPDRLGCTANEVAHLARPGNVAALAAAGVRVFTDPPLESWHAMLEVESARPLVIIGSLAWLRRALQHVLEGGEVSLDVVGQGRLADGTLGWWVEAARALHPSSPSLIPAIVKLCGGVPLLAGEIDTLLVGSPASELTEVTWKEVESEFELKIDVIAARLMDSGLNSSLTTRERELLIMAQHVAKALDGGEFDLDSEFRLYWDMCESCSITVDPPFSHREDRLALQLLVSSGLLSVTDERTSIGLGRARIDPRGTFGRVVAQLERHHAA